MSTSFNILKTTPEKDDRYFFDTNVWFWTTYKASTDYSDAERKIAHYSDFVEKILNVGAKIFHCPLIYTELANVIEKTEYEKYKSNTHLKISRKEFRAIPASRAKVLDEIRTAWQTVCTLSQGLELTLNNETMNKVQLLMDTNLLDSYDAIYLKFMELHNIKLLVSDDSDMGISSDLEIYTINRKLLSS